MKRFIFSIFLILTFGIVFISCNCKKKTIEKSDAVMQNEKQNVQGEISYKILFDNDRSNIKEEKHLVINSEDALKALYAKINMTRRPGLPVPKINFKEEMAGGICLGEKRNAGYKIVIEKIETISNERVVLYKVQTPKETAATVMTQPCLLFSMPKTELPIKFVEIL